MQRTSSWTLSEKTFTDEGAPECPIRFDNVGEWTAFLCDIVIPLLRHFFGKHFRREIAQVIHMELSCELFDAVCVLLQSRINLRTRVLEICSCLEVICLISNV